MRDIEPGSAVVLLCRDDGGRLRLASPRMYRLRSGGLTRARGALAKRLGRDVRPVMLVAWTEPDLLDQGLEGAWRAAE